MEAIAPTILYGIYGRTSTDQQETGLESQLMACRAHAEMLKLKVAREYLDDGVSGKEDSRPQFDLMLTALRAGEIGGIIAYDLSRLSRNAYFLLGLRNEVVLRGWSLEFKTQKFDLTTPAGRFVFLMMAGVAELNRETTVENVKNGKARGARDGVKQGRKVKRDDVAILALVDQGLKPAAVALSLKIARSAVYRAIEAREKVATPPIEPTVRK